MRIDLAIQKCLKNGIKVYPVYTNYRWFIEAEICGKPKRFDKPVKEININDAVTKTYLHYAEKL